ncbi:PadR family transcriptional regulator [Natronoglycomyces albus]|uniref:PadR family transcriptional regulator n=1 Tax=Natronoglycomyces albus TaxID=2811108 RepID=A0A895XRW1_9ACTN|nr:PadR family transcriptional regulator [Natronoglycomyces albus]QSB05000.1 PadR family transcriptional regulator [Natronoglycomyces albus]
MWSTRLFVLGLVRWLGPIHGYDVHQELTSWSVPGLHEIKPGSIYHALKKLTGEGLLEVDSTEQDPGRPARTTYRITAAGESTFHSILRQRLWDENTNMHDFGVVWAFAPALADSEAIAALQRRAEYLQTQMDTLTADIAARSTTSDKSRSDYLPPHVRSMLRLVIQQLAVAADWCDETAARIEAGELDIGTDPSVEEARLWRESIRRERMKKFDKGN